MGAGRERGGGGVPASTPPPVEEGAPLWTVTFGDMMSLLLTFFILMFSMSELKVDRFLLASQSLREAVGGTAEISPEEALGLMPDPVDPDLLLENPGPGQGAADADGDGEADWLTSMTDAYVDMLARRLATFVDEGELEDLIKVDREADGVYLRIQSAALFPSGSATMQSEGERVVEELAAITRETEVGVSVSGHADDRPISTAQFPSNWELSAARAAGVARVLLANGHSPEMIRVESFGEFRPVASNETAEGRAMNRRVELFYARGDIIKAVQAWAESAEGGVDEGEPDTPQSAPPESVGDAPAAAGSEVHGDAG